MGWTEDYGEELARISRGDFGNCPECGNPFTEQDILNQIDAESQERAELCIKCWIEWKRSK